MKIHSPDKLILDHVSINLIRIKFDSLIYMPISHVKLISETKLDDSLPLTQFKMELLFIPYRYSRNEAWWSSPL